MKYYSFTWSPWAVLNPYIGTHSLLIVSTESSLWTWAVWGTLQAPMALWKATPSLSKPYLNLQSTHLHPQCTSIEGHMVSIRWYLGSLQGQLGGPSKNGVYGFCSISRITIIAWSGNIQTILGLGPEYINKTYLGLVGAPEVGTVLPKAACSHTRRTRSDDTVTCLSPRVYTTPLHGASETHKGTANVSGSKRGR